MNFKLRLFPLVMSLAITSMVLFGGWFIYQSVALKSPLAQIVMDIPGVERVETTIQKDRVIVELTLSKHAQLREIYRTIQSEGRSIIENRHLQIHVVNPSSPELEQWWSRALFDIAEAMETQNYSDIPKTLEGHKANLANLHVSAEMDEVNVYIRLIHGDDSKFIILPRIPPQLGVWANE